MYITESFRYCIEMRCPVKYTVRLICKEFISTALTPNFNNIFSIFNINTLSILAAKVIILK